MREASATNAGEKGAAPGDGTLREERTIQGRVRIAPDAIEQWVGREVAVSPWHVVGQPMIDAFAAVIDDHQWIHVDRERARAETAFGTTIAHGFLTLSLLTALLESAIETPGWGAGINYGFDRLRFTAPVPEGSRVRGRFGLAALTRLAPKGALREGVQFAWDVTVEIDGAAQPAIVARWLTRRYA